MSGIGLSIFFKSRENSQWAAVWLVVRKLQQNLISLRLCVEIKGMLEVGRYTHWNHKIPNDNILNYMLLIEKVQ